MGTTINIMNQSRPQKERLNRDSDPRGSVGDVCVCVTLLDVKGHKSHPPPQLRGISGALADVAACAREALPPPISEFPTDIQQNHPELSCTMGYAGSQLVTRKARRRPIP
jgi:hypothetical protein